MFKKNEKYGNPAQHKGEHHHYKSNAHEEVAISHRREQRPRPSFEMEAASACVIFAKKFQDLQYKIQLTVEYLGSFDHNQ